jgi:hypothetical protein
VSSNWSSISGASGVPTYVALPMAPLRNGSPSLPEHSSVELTSWRGPSPDVVERQRHRLLNQSADLQAPCSGVENGFVVVGDAEELVMG